VVYLGDEGVKKSLLGLIGSHLVEGLEQWAEVAQIVAEWQVNVDVNGPVVGLSVKKTGESLAIVYAVFFIAQFRIIEELPKAILEVQASHCRLPL
jgi:hypothetical protein